MDDLIQLRKAEQGLGYSYQVTFPSSDRLALLEVVRAFKEVVPQSARMYTRPTWLFRRAYLSPVRALCEQYALLFQWHLLDTTSLSKEEALRVIEGRRVTEQGARVEAFLGAIQEVPAGALRLSGIFPEALVFDLEQRVPEPTYRQLLQACLPARQVAALPALPFRSKHPTRLAIPLTDELLAGLLVIPALTGHSLEGLHVLGPLSVISLFPDGVIHARDQVIALWVGAPVRQAIRVDPAYGFGLFRPGGTYHL